MRVCILGLGYVGAVVSACLSRNGHRVVGVDLNETKVATLNAGRSPIVEPQLEELISAGVEEGRLYATTDVRAAVADSEISMICVGTPSQADGSLDLQYVERVSQQIGEVLAERDRGDYHVVVVRSTMLPGSVEQTVIPAIEAGSGDRLLAGRDFGVVFNPEFLRESSAVKDFDHPPKTVIGEHTPRAGEVAASLYADLQAPLLRVSLRTAEMVKYCDNLFHALKITFGNEVGALCAEFGIDSHEVMDVFCQDRKLNISPAYLKPGYAYGGSCLPKDLRAILSAARSRGLQVPVLQGIEASNGAQIERGIDLVAEGGRRPVALLGLAFKSGTDDLRESPLVTLAERLLGKGFPLTIYDRHVSVAALTGANRAYVERHIPHLSRLLCDTIDDAIADADVVVIGNPSPEFRERLGDFGDREIIDLVRICPTDQQPARYRGLSW